VQLTVVSLQRTSLPANSSKMFGLWASRWRLSGVMKINWDWVSDMITAFVWGGIIVVVISVFLLGSPG
jgi:hypothetical protein